MRVLISGAAGFLGSNVARHLSARGVELTLVTPREAPALRSLPGARLLIGRVEGRIDEATLAAHDALLHFASTTNPRVGTVVEELRQLEDLARLLERARVAPALRLVYCSSGGTIYREAARPHREDDPLEPRIPYAWGKLAAEELIAFHGRAHGLRHLVLRCSNVYGPGQSVDKRQGVIVKLLTDLREGRATEVWGDGRAVRDYLFVGDLCALLEAALAAPHESGTFNVGAGVGTSILDLAAVIAEVTGRAPRLVHTPAEAGSPATSVLDPARAGQAFGWRPSTPLREGIRATWEWVEGA